MKKRNRFFGLAASVLLIVPMLVMSPASRAEEAAETPQSASAQDQPAATLADNWVPFSREVYMERVGDAAVVDEMLQTRDPKVDYMIYSGIIYEERMLAWQSAHPGEEPTAALCREIVAQIDAESMQNGRYPQESAPQKAPQQPHPTSAKEYFIMRDKAEIDRRIAAGESTSEEALQEFREQLNQEIAQMTFPND